MLINTTANQNRSRSSALLANRIKLAMPTVAVGLCVSVCVPC